MVALPAPVQKQLSALTRRVEAQTKLRLAVEDIIAVIGGSDGPPSMFEYAPGMDITAMGGTHTRADASTCARYRDSSGIWQVVAANVLLCLPALTLSRWAEGDHQRAGAR